MEDRKEQFIKELIFLEDKTSSFWDDIYLRENSEN